MKHHEEHRLRESRQDAEDQLCHNDSSLAELVKTHRAAQADFYAALERLAERDLADRVAAIELQCHVSSLHEKDRVIQWIQTHLGADWKEQCWIECNQPDKVQSPPVLTSEGLLVIAQHVEVHNTRCLQITQHILQAVQLGLRPLCTSEESEEDWHGSDQAGFIFPNTSHRDLDERQEDIMALCSYPVRQPLASHYFETAASTEDWTRVFVKIKIHAKMPCYERLRQKAGLNSILPEFDLEETAKNFRKLYGLQ